VLSARARILGASNKSLIMLVHGRPSRSDAAHPHPLSLSKNNTHALGCCLEIPHIDLEPAHLPVCLSPLPLPLPPSSSTAPLGLGVRCSLWLGSAEGQHVGLSVVAASERGEAGGSARQALQGRQWPRQGRAPRGPGYSSVQVPVCHSRESPGMFRLPDRGADPWCLPWCCSKPDFSVVAPALPSPMLYIYVLSASDILDVCCNCFHLDVAKVDQRDVAHVTSVSEACCKRLIKMFYLFFRRMLQSFFYLDVAYVSHICCNSMLQMFQLFQSNVAASGFILQVAILDVSRFAHMQQENLIFASCFHISLMCL
jgi:hypothetical protein